MTQTLIVRAICTTKIPLFQSFASLPMLLITATIMGIGMYLPFSPIASSREFVPLPSFSSVVGWYAHLLLRANSICENLVRQKIRV